MIGDCPDFEFGTQDASCLRQELRELLIRLAGIYLPKAPHPPLLFCNDELDQRFKSLPAATTNPYQVGRVPLDTMAFLIKMKTRLREKDFVGLATAKSGNTHAGKFFYFADRTGLGNRWQENKIWKTVGTEELTSLIQAVTEKLPLESYQADPACMLTIMAYPQPPHRDMKGCVAGEEWRQPYYSYILHLPLCEEGMFLNIWEDPDDKSVPPLRIHVPFGTFLLLRMDVVHGGVFGSSGNVRLHIAFRPTKTAIEAHLKDKGLSDKQKQSCMELGIDGHIQSKDRALDKVLTAYDTDEDVNKHGEKVDMIPKCDGYVAGLKEEFKFVARCLGGLKLDRRD